MGCATGTIKFALFAVNTLWTILGILVVIFGALGWGAMPQEYSIGIVVLGGVILTISLFGCFGALRESARMMWTYASFLVILLALLVIFVFMSTQNVFQKYAMEGVEAAWNKERTHPGAMDLIQITNSCCGRDSAKDYINIGRTPSASCCRDNNCVNPLNLYLTGCLKKVEEAFADEATTTKYCEWGLLGFDLVLCILAFMLAIHYTNRKRRFNY